MKKILFMLVFSGISCSFVSSQTVFYNRGAVVTKSTDKTKAIVYIKGSMAAGTDVVSGNTSAIAIEQAKVILTGDLINDVAKGATGGTVFVPLSTAQAGILEFRGSTPQKITSSGTTFSTIPSKEHNYIAFPHIEINNKQHVTIQAQLAAKTKDIDLKKGWLILDSKEATVAKDNALDAANESVLAHLLVEGAVNYNKSAWTAASNPEDRGFVEVRLAVSSEGTQSDKSLVGFGSPFKELGNDYFMYNTILAPSTAGFMGDTGKPISDPEVVLEAGKGYVLGIDLRGMNAADYDEPPYNTTISFDHRAHEGYYFNRHHFSTDVVRKNNQIHGLDPTQAIYGGEELNTSDVTFNLKEGYNYLSNPFTAPLSLDKLLENDQAQASWGVVVDVYTNPNVEVANRFWIINTDSKASPVAGNIKRTNYSFNYYVATNPGGTYYPGGDNEMNVAPLQVFMLYSYGNHTLKIPASERTMGNVKFLRNTPQKKARRDDFIIEVRDKQIGTSDRVSVVLRPEQEIKTNPNFSNVKRLVSSSSQDRDGSGLQEAVSEQNIGSQLYTRIADNTEMTVQFFPTETTSRIQLHYIPSSTAQGISLRGLRLESMDEVGEIYLEDKKYNTSTRLFPETVYETTCEPTDSETRFALRLRATTGVGEETADLQNIYAHDSNGSIWVEGFENSDMGNKLELIDLNGRILSTRSVNDLKLKLSDTHTAGVYIIKMSGSRLQTIKLIAR